MRIPMLALALALNAVTVASAQTYATPAPHSTSIPDMRNQAHMRLITERFHRGLAAMNARDWERANAEFAAVLETAPPEPQGSSAAYDDGIALFELGRYEAAAHAFQIAIERDPGFLAAMANLVAVDLQRGDPRDARTVAERFVQAAPDSARAHYSRGLAALASNDFATARADFSQLLQRDPRYAVAHYDLGVTEIDLGDYAAAEREFNAAVTLAPSYARARFALATVLLHDGARTAARDAFDRAARDARDDISLRTLSIEMRDAIVVH